MLNLFRRFFQYLVDRREAQCTIRDVALTLALYAEILDELKNGYLGNHQGMRITDPKTLMHEHMTDANQYTSSLYELVRISVYSNAANALDALKQNYKKGDFKKIKAIYEEWLKRDSEMREGHKLVFPKIPTLRK